jgi:hypothetical protein
MVQSLSLGQARHRHRLLAWAAMSTVPGQEPTPQRLAAIRDQLKLLADYL